MFGRDVCQYVQLGPIFKVEIVQQGTIFRATAKKVYDFLEGGDGCGGAIS
jgi:hypothetical protein